MPQEPSDLDRIEIFYEEVGTADQVKEIDDEEPEIFLEETGSSGGLSTEDVSLLSQDLSNPDRFDAPPPEPAEFD